MLSSSQQAWARTVHCCEAEPLKASRYPRSLFKVEFFQYTPQTLKIISITVLFIHCGDLDGLS